MTEIEQYFQDLQDTVFPDEVWSNAPCTQIGLPDAWFDVDTRSDKQEIHMLKVALETCNSCHLRPECLELGMQGEDIYWGVWGGLFPAERQALSGRGNLAIVRRGLSAVQSLRRRTGVQSPTLGDRDE